MDARMKMMMQMLGGFGGDTNALANEKFAGTFGGFTIYNDGQKPVVELLQRLSDKVVDYAAQLVADENPFEEGKILSIVSPPGRGKTHLVEAFINRLKEAEPRVLSRVLHTTNLQQYRRCPACGTDHIEVPIVIGDDLFKANSDATGVAQLSEDDVKWFQDLATYTWENRRFMIITCNFPVLEPMFQRIRALDMVGRGASRLNGLIAASKEVTLPGVDYRNKMATEARASAGDDSFTI